jgi:hypothetical protein
MEMEHNNRGLRQYVPTYFLAKHAAKVSLILDPKTSLVYVKIERLFRHFQCPMIRPRILPDPRTHLGHLDHVDELGAAAPRVGDLHHLRFERRDVLGLVQRHGRGGRRLGDATGDLLQREMRKQQS